MSQIDVSTPSVRVRANGQLGAHQSAGLNAQLRADGQLGAHEIRRFPRKPADLWGS
jgi:hypothetical protein